MVIIYGHLSGPRGQVALLGCFCGKRCMCGSGCNPRPEQGMKQAGCGESPKCQVLRPFLLLTEPWHFGDSPQPALSFPVPVLDCNLNHTCILFHKSSRGEPLDLGAHSGQPQPLGWGVGGARCPSMPEGHRGCRRCRSQVLIAHESRHQSCHLGSGWCGSLRQARPTVGVLCADIGCGTGIRRSLKTAVSKIIAACSLHGQCRRTRHPPSV